jgi:hypothetical protein
MAKKRTRLKDKLPSQAISWLGILGGALTIVSNLEGVITLSNWARILVSSWTDWMTAAWSWLLAAFGIDAPSAFVIAWWTVSLFIVAISIGARLTGGRAGDFRSLFKFSIKYEYIELWALVLVLVALLVIPTYSDRSDELWTTIFVAVPYAVAVTLAQIISDTAHFVKRLRLTVGVVFMALALNWISTLFSDWL